MQEEKNELRAKSMASVSTAPPQNPNPDKPPKPKVREEGELTSSDDDALPASSVLPSTSISAPPSSVDASLKTYVQGINSGKSVSTNLPARYSDIQSQTAGYRKGFSKNQVLLKSTNPGWRAPGANSNLVISFSDDDDSGTDGEERRHKNSRTGNKRPQVEKGSRQSSALPNVELVATGKDARNEGKVAPKRLSSSCASVSSMSKIHGSNLRSGVPSAEQKSWSKNSIAASRILSIQDRGGSKNVDLSSSKLQDLRQQIAMRENELKLKIVQKNKENVAELGRNKNTSKERREVPSDVWTESKEPDKKRLKKTQNGSEQPNSSDCRVKLAESLLVSGEPLLKNPACRDGNAADHVRHNTDDSLRELLPCPDGRQLLPASQSKGSRMLKDAPALTVSCSFSDWNSKSRETLDLPKQTAALTNSTSTDPLDKSNPGVVCKNQPSTSAANQDVDENNMIKVNDHFGAVAAYEKLMSASDSSLRARSLQVSDSKFGSPDASLDNTSLLHSLGMSRVLGRGDLDVLSLFETEDLHDKELEEAQEQRRRCEVEERNALKIYRQAQRALAEANARCTYLYRRRELYSAQLRSLMMEDSSLLWSSSQQGQIGDIWNLSNTASDVDLDLIPGSGHQTQADFEAGDQLHYDSNAQSADGDAQYRFSGNEDGHNLGFEACSEPDASSSGLIVQGKSFAANGVHSRSNDQTLSPDNDDDETFSLENRSVHANVTSQREEDNSKECVTNMDVDLPTNFSADGSRDPLLLEAYLRSKLFSRLGIVASSQENGVGVNSESTTAGVAGEDVAGAKTQMILDSMSVSDHEVLNGDCGEGSREPGGRISMALVDIQKQQHVEEHSLNDSPIPTFELEDRSSHFISVQPTSIFPSPSIFRSAMKAAGSVSSDYMLTTEQSYGSPDTCNDDNLLIQCGQDTLSLDKVSSIEEVAKCASFSKIDSYTCKSTINPFWPLCMYELRGRCNNDECPWQHVKDFSPRNVSQHNNSDNADWQTGSSSHDRTELSNILTPPRYLVCLDSLKAESHTCSSLQARELVSSQKNTFSNSLAVSSSLLKHFPSDEPYLHGNDGCVESYGGSRHSLYFQSRNGSGNPLRNGSAGNDQSLEMALLVLNQEMNKIEGAKKALSVLSRALEADPASFNLWIIYLLLYYSTKSSVGEFSKTVKTGEDDLFSFAVKHNERSYDLWLLYINSRRRLNDRFAAYERALSSLCHHASDNNGSMVHTSAAILDLFLQMLNCFSMSGNVAKAVQRIHRLVLTDRDADESHSLLLSDILECLTVSDKCIFWVCCVYLVIYRKLPDALVQQFEFEKDISVVEWPAVSLTLEEKQQVSELMKVAVDSVGLLIDSSSPERSVLKSAHVITVNHIKLMAAVDGEESYKKLLEKYRNSYPSCLELVLLSARAHGYVNESTNFEGFEETLHIWPKEVPGIQCIWNQFAEYALENGKPDRAKEIVEKWFHAVWEPQILHKSSSEHPLSGSNWVALQSSSNKMDLMFGLLNLSLYRLFTNDVFEAHLAIDKARSLGDPEVLKHCVKEQAVFLFNNGSQLKKDVSFHGLVDILKGLTARAIPTRDPLTRKFIQDIQKPRLRQLVSNLLSPISPDSFLVNSVLEVWFGPSLLPQKPKELKHLVDFVEAVLEVSPANYQLVISVCRLLCSDSIASNTKSASVLFWASSLLVNTIYRAISVPPEYIWAEAANLLGKLTNIQEISESFHQRALSVYPFSIKLWKSFLNLSTTPVKRSSVLEAARDKGIELD